MYKVMIVDDETWIRRGIMAQIEWERLGLTPDSEAADGIEALKMAEERMPDILITDVRMPEMDGLALAEKLLEQNPLLKVVIVSGYSEFNYVKAAIQLPAMSYILKPIDPIELNQTLQKAVERLEAESMERLAIHHLPDVVEKQAADLCNGTGTQAVISSFLDAIQLRKMEGRCMAAVIFHYDDSQFDAESMLSHLMKAAASLPMGERRLLVWDRGGTRLSAIVFANDRTGIHLFVKHLLLALGKDNISGIWAASGDPADISEPGFLSRSYKEAQDMSERYSIHRKDSFIPFTPGEEEQTSFLYPLHLQKKLNDSFSRGDRNGCSMAAVAMQQYFHQTEGATLKHARSFFLSVVSDIVRNMLSMPTFHEVVVEKGFAFCLNIDAYEDLQRMTDWLTAYLQEAIGVREQANQRDIHRSILAAAEYIREHYNEDISLSSVSTRYYITSSYFSSMFKEIIGENFVEYLTRIRMEKAKELLTDTSHKIGQISEMVGYADSRYFSKLFKKHTGWMPTEFRQGTEDTGEETP